MITRENPTQVHIGISKQAQSIKHHAPVNSVMFGSLPFGPSDEHFGHKVHLEASTHYSYEDISLPSYQIACLGPALRDEWVVGPGRTGVHTCWAPGCFVHGRTDTYSRPLFSSQKDRGAHITLRVN